MTMLPQRGWNIAIHMVGLDGSVFSCPIPNWKGRPGLVSRILQMYEKHGLTVGERCKTCRHLERYEPPRTEEDFGYGVPTETPVDGPSFPKCRAFSGKNGRTTDWRLNWPACGRWNQKEAGGGKEV